VAQYTSIDTINLVEVSRHYGLTDAVAQPLKGGAANSSFRVDTPNGRLHPPLWPDPRGRTDPPGSTAALLIQFEVGSCLAVSVG
jgi:hypothetical protein